MDDPTMKEVPFEDRFGMLVSIAAIDYQSGRKLNKAVIFTVFLNEKPNPQLCWGEWSKQ